MHLTYLPLHGDGSGDDGEQLRKVATTLVEWGWDAEQIMAKVKPHPWIPLHWDDERIRREIEACGAKPGPPPAAPAAGVARVVDDGIPGWLRALIESEEIPADRDKHFRDVVSALANIGWDSWTITVKIVSKVWLPTRYATNDRHLEWGVTTIVMAAMAARADSRASLRVKVAPNAAAAVVEVAVPTNDVAAPDLRAVQLAIAAGRWRENPQAKDWAGRAVAAALKLNVETDRAEIVSRLKAWIADGSLVVVEGADERRKPRAFIQIGDEPR